MSRRNMPIPHPAHPHPLILVGMRGSFICIVCRKEKEDASIYECRRCYGVKMCAKCYHATIRPSIKYRYHEHFLCFIEEYYDHIAHCKAFDNYCHQSMASDHLHHSTKALFFCLNCDFKIHFICGPLPNTIKHECHIHPLILVDSIVESNSDDYYCDVCEFERNPRIRVYYCSKCQYIAHPYCVISEIVKLFKGDLGGVKLKFIGQDLWEDAEEEWDMSSSSLTLLDLLSSNNLTGPERVYLSLWFKWDESSKAEEDSEVEVADEDIDEIIRYPFFNRQEFTSFFYHDFDKFWKEEALVVKSSDLSHKIVGVQDYRIPVTLAPVLQTFLHKYGDISSDSDRTPAMKSICFFFLCKLIKSMHTTRFADITNSLLREWYYYLTFVSLGGKFRIDFVMPRQEMVTRAFAGLQLARLETEIPKKIASLQREIAELQQEIAHLKAKEDIFNKSSSNPEFIKDSLREGAELKWMTVGQVLF